MPEILRISAQHNTQNIIQLTHFLSSMRWKKKKIWKKKKSSQTKLMKCQWRHTVYVATDGIILSKLLPSKGPHHHKYITQSDNI